MYIHIYYICYLCYIYIWYPYIVTVFSAELRWASERLAARTPALPLACAAAERCPLDLGCGMNIICILCVSVYVYYVITIYDIYIIYIYVHICRWYMCIQLYTCGVHRCVDTNKYPHHRVDSHHQQESTGSLRYSKSLLLVHQCQRLTGEHVQTPQAFSCFWCFWFMVGRKRNKTNLIGKMMIRPYFGGS